MGTVPTKQMRTHEGRKMAALNLVQHEITRLVMIGMCKGREEKKKKKFASKNKVRAKENKWKGRPFCQTNLNFKAFL